VVGDEVLRLSGQRHELAGPAIAASGLDGQLPSQRVLSSPWISGGCVALMSPLHQVCLIHCKSMEVALSPPPAD
jgi:hypothetical protein